MYISNQNIDARCDVMFVFPNFTFIEKHSHQKIGRTMWLTYSCDGDAVKDETLFEDRRRGIWTWIFYWQVLWRFLISRKVDNGCGKMWRVGSPCWFLRWLWRANELQWTYRLLLESSWKHMQTKEYWKHNGYRINHTWRWLKHWIEQSCFNK